MIFKLNKDQANKLNLKENQKILIKNFELEEATASEIYKYYQDIPNKDYDLITKVEQEGPIIWNKSGWLIRDILTKRAAEHFGCDQGWCTAHVGGSYYDQSYSKKYGDLYILYKGNKVYGQLFVAKDKKRTEFQAPHNQEIDIDEFRNEFPELEDFFIKVVKLKKVMVFSFIGRKIPYEEKNGILVFRDIDVSDSGLSSLKELPWYGKEYIITGNFDCSYNKLTSLKGSPKEIGGYFYCFENNLTNLEGSPKEVGGSFICYSNKLTSLKDGPEKVGGDFDCYSNQLITLEGAPKEVGHSFFCYRNNLTNLKGAPKEVGGDFSCYRNKLTSLKDAPNKVGGNFECSENNLTNLKGAPEKVGGYFNCSYNNLTSLKGAPKEVGGDFGCYNNQLITLEGSPKEVGKNFNCYNNKIKFTEEDVKKVSKVKGEIRV